MADVPHIRFPFQRGHDGKVVMVEQDTAEHIKSCEAVIIRCPSGHRPAKPEFGWPWPTFRNAPLRLDELERALRTFEPRSEATAAEKASEASQAIRDVTVTLPIAEEDSSG